MSIRNELGLETNSLRGHRRDGTSPAMVLLECRLVGLEAQTRDGPARHHGHAARLRRLQATTRPIEPPIPQRTSDDGSGTELIEASIPP
jgi:hypothetical protein